MKIIQTKTTEQSDSYFSEVPFQCLFEADNKIWDKANKRLKFFGSASIIGIIEVGTTSKVTWNPTATKSEDQIYTYYSLTTTSPTQVFYIPSEEVTIDRLMENLSLYLPNTNIQKQLEFLALKLENNKKQLTTWDTYNIYRVVYNRDDFVMALASQPLSSSIVVNTTDATITVGAQTYSKGDMVVKDAYGATHYIPGSNGGYYFPRSITTFEGEEDTGLFQLNFGYSTTQPLPATESQTNNVLTSDKPLETPYETIKVTFPETTISNNQCYAGNKELEPAQELSIAYNTKDDVKIEPIVYCYLQNTGERIIFPEDYKVDGAYFKIKNTTKMSIDCEVR